MAKKGGILGMGNPLLDISATVTPEFLEKFGLDANNQILAEEKHMPIYEELVASFSPDFIAGGATQNSIRVAQWMLQSPGATSYMGCVGKDSYADTLKAKAEEGGTKVEYMVDESTPTGTCAVLITGTDRSLVANISAANNYKEEHLADVGMPLVEEADLVYISGFFLTVSPPSIVTVGKHVAEKNKTMCVNLAAPFICEFFKDPLMDAINYADIVFGNETEFASFGKAQGYDTEDLSEIALRITRLPKANAGKKRLAIVTQGKDPTIIACDGEVRKYPIAELAADKIVDTNGAGDAWVGGFIAAYSLNKNIEECTKAASYAAAVIIQQSGCTYPEKPDYSL